MRTRLVRVRRKPRGMRWAVFFLMLAMAAYIGAAMPALRKMQAALCEMVVEGVEHNGYFQSDLIGEAAFEDGSYTTGFLNGR